MQIQLTEYFYFNLVVIICYLGFPGSSVVRNPPAMQETLVQFLGWEDSLEKGMGTHSSILAWRIQWTV